MTLLTIALASPSFGQVACAPRDAMIAQLATMHGETRRFVATTRTEHGPGLIEIFGANGKTWTMTFTAPGGLMCIVAIGDNFQPVTDPDGVEG